ncbi:MAG TPA: hypothetical protein VMV46_04625 [Thermoanaerobaculia bacterium]|nr:hypothetical protein [Thermoanaerobaculia bacterium]
MDDRPAQAPVPVLGLVPVLVLAALALAAPGPAQTPAPAPPTCDAPEHRQFDFWVGLWRVATPDGALAGTNRIESVLNGCVLMESWEGNGGSVGKSFNMYDRRVGQWRQTWVDGSGGRLDLVGGLVDGRMVLSGTTPGRDGGELLHEIAWQRLEGGAVEQRWRVSRDGGETWVDSFVGIYEKQEP